jgi:hypothetical protein
METSACTWAEGRERHGTPLDHGHDKLEKDGDKSYLIDF